MSEPRKAPMHIGGKRILGILDMVATLKHANVEDSVILSIVIQQLELVLE